MTVDPSPRGLQRTLLAVMLAALLAGCATAGGGPQADAASDAAGKAAPGEPGDPLEGFNRAMYKFNEKFDQYLLKPVAKGYRAVLPSPVRTGIANFFGNLKEPIVIVNDLLQGKFTQALSDTSRFVWNTTAGIGGLLDPASHLGLPRHNEDFGQTLGKWGAGEGVYIVWPILGPSSLRDTGGLVGDWYSYPPTYLQDTPTRWAMYVTDTVDTRSRLLEAGDILEQAAGQDPYLFVRAAYRQRRESLIYDGNPPREEPKGLFEDDDAPPSPKPVGP